MTSRMELTSLLNTPGADRRLPSISEQRGSMDIDDAPPHHPSEQRARPMHRSRTPWDGNGYSLSVAQSSAGTSAAIPDTMEPQPQPHMQHCGSPSSTSPRHRISDSRSSLSSAYTAVSDGSSISHSRLSSLSTVSENQPLATLTHNFKYLESQMPDSWQAARQVPPCPPSSQPSPQSASAHRHHHHHHHHHHSQQSPHASLALNTDFLVDESRARLQRLDLKLPPSAENAGLEPMTAEADTSANDQMSRRRLFPPSHHSSASIKHKRAASAPDYRSDSASSSGSHQPVFGPIPEPTPSPSQDSDVNMDRLTQSATPDGDQPSPSAQDNTAYISFGWAPGTVMSKSNSHDSHGSHERRASFSSDSSEDESTPSFIDVDGPLSCMYRTNCMTGSQMRKAISHIFGRNKICTRSIPTGVWVHYCRKHYQRTRYRNGMEYPRRQISLVRKQIRRVQIWSDMNARTGNGPILTAWVLGVRKREQMRLDRAAAAGRKRSYDEDDGEDDYHGAGGNGHTDANSSTAVPDWIVPLIKSTFTTPQILDFVAKLRDQINAGLLRQIPDIEILPIIDGPDGTTKPSSPSTSSVKKMPKSRAENKRTHRRVQSVSAPMRSDPMRHDAMVGHRSSHSVSTGYYMPPSYLPPAAYADRSYQDMPVEKRQRTDSVSSEYLHTHGNLHGHSMHERHHSVSSVPASGHYGYGVLPAPNPQRPADSSVAQRLEEAWPSVDHHHHDHRGAWTHQRSQSEAVYPRHHGGHRPTASFAYASDPRNNDYMHRPAHHHGVPVASEPSGNAETLQLPKLKDVPAMHENPPAHYHGLPEIQTAHLESS